MATHLWAIAAGSALAISVVLMIVGSIYLCRLDRQSDPAISEEISISPTVIRKLRKHQKMTLEELRHAEVIVAQRKNFRAFCIPLTLFFLASFYVFGSLAHLDGAAPSERTFLGVIPMMTSTNLTIQLARCARLTKRLDEARRMT